MRDWNEIGQDPDDIVDDAVLKDVNEGLADIKNGLVFTTKQVRELMGLMRGGQAP